MKDDTLILTFNRETDHLEIGGECSSLLLMLDILGRAQRCLQQKWETEERMKTLAQFQDAARTAQLVSKLNGGR